VRIRYTYEARSYGQAAPRWQDATPQRLRWYGGAFDLQKRYLGPLTTRTLAKGSTDALDKLLELVLPPFSLLAAGSAAVWVWGFLLRRNRSRRGFGADTLRLALAVLFPVAGLAAARAPARCYRALLAGPVYVAWRLLLVIRSRIGYRRVSWVRTRRSGS
jgi:hypothetical protein